MKVILVDCRHIGAAFACARKCSGVHRMAAANMLGITYQDLLRYERGDAVIPEQILHRVMANGFILIRSKSGQKY